MNWSLQVPWGYGRQYKSLSEVRDLLAPYYQPESLHRFLVRLHAWGGEIGVGSWFRETQPDKPGVAPEGKSFHQRQHYADGSSGASAIDVVKRNPAGGNHVAVTWADVDPQGTAAAKRWGVHANVGKPGDPYPKGEQWHLQPVEIDGHDTWLAAGRPAPQPGYPLPTHSPDPGEDDDMPILETPVCAYDSRPAENDRKVPTDLRTANAGVPKAPLAPGQTRTIVVGYCSEATVNVTAIGSGQAGYLAVNDPSGKTSTIGFDPADKIESNCVPVRTPNGTITVTAVVGSADFAIDVLARRP